VNDGIDPRAQPLGLRSEQACAFLLGDADPDGRQRIEDVARNDFATDLSEARGL
jgi:hypothetical protein